MGSGNDRTTAVSEETGRRANKKLNSNTIKEFEKRYDKIVLKGYRCNPHPPDQSGRRGRKKKSKPLNLLERLKNYKGGILGFMNDFAIPFDNNQAERDLRMTKVQQKITGCFRSDEGGMIFSRIRGYISTVKKYNENVFEALQGLFNDRLFMPYFAE